MCIVFFQLQAWGGGLGTEGLGSADSTEKFLEAGGGGRGGEPGHSSPMGLFF